MALYAIGDLHLSHNTNKPMDVFGGNWIDYMDKLTQGLKVLSDDDVCVLCGDTSWAMSLEEGLEDFRYIDNLPGRKIIVKGNHDYWWSTLTKINAFFEANDIKTIDILFNNAYYYEGVAICGTRSWLSDDKLTPEQNAKIIAREVTRLRTSLEAATDTPARLCFFHYPPRFGTIVTQDIVDVMNEFAVTKCYYGHLHSEGHRIAVRGIIEGISYDIISADYINFTPQKIQLEGMAT